MGATHKRELRKRRKFARKGWRLKTRYFRYIYYYPEMGMYVAVSVLKRY